MLGGQGLYLDSIRENGVGSILLHSFFRTVIKALRYFPNPISNSKDMLILAFRMRNLLTIL